MPIGYLYVTESKVDGMFYVGQSSRIDEHSVATYLGSGDYFAQALAQHGAENFTKTILGYFDEQADLDYAEVHAIARLRAHGCDLYNGGVGGPRAQRQFIRAMFERFGVFPTMTDAWLAAVETNVQEVRALIAKGAEVSSDDFYVEYEAQLLQTQDLTGECPRCGAAVGAVCRTRTDKPSRNHVKRPVAA